MLQCSLMLLVHSVLAAAAFRGNEKERCTESAPWLSSSVEMLHGVWRYCSEMPNHHARGHDTEWKTSSLFLLLWVWVRPRRTCRHDGRSVWLSLCSLGKYATTLSRVCCFGGNVLAAVRLPNGGRGAGGKCVSAAVRSRAGCLAAEGIAHPTQHCSCRASSITLQHRYRRHQHAARQRKPPPPRVRPFRTRLLLRSEGAHRVAQWRVQNLIAESAHDTGNWPRNVCVKWDTAVESLPPSRWTDA
ncbi:trans-sialidase [Trypanosoma cruzi]|nr:trans-sialidase [Trypanosoma cruzi]